MYRQHSLVSKFISIDSEANAWYSKRVISKLVTHDNQW